jgi:UDP-perosamine 4-acetyltransferase
MALWLKSPPVDLVLIGARADGHAGVVLDTLVEGLPHRVVAFLDETEALWGTKVRGIEVLGGPEELGRALSLGARGGVISIADPSARERLSELLLEAGVTLPTIVHPRAFVAPSASLGRGVFVGPMAGIGAGARIEDFALVQSASYVGHNSRVERAAALGGMVMLGGRTRIGARASLGLSTVVIPDVSVGHDAVVGAGAVVIREVEPRTTVAGVPARVLR